jgi:hypothetical protein
MRALIVLLGMLAVSLAQAAVQVPAPLDPWRDWVLKDQEFRACPLIAGRGAAAQADFACLWPGTLHLHADAQGALLRQRWTVEVEGWVPLPGDRQHWPQQVRVDGKAVPVVDRAGPQLWMAAGEHELEARMIWSERPQSLRVPQSIALIDLIVDGKPVAPLQRAGDQLTLGRGKAAAVEADSIDLRVFRRFTDDIPGRLDTSIRINASGQAREETIGPVLPEGFVALALVSEQWSARLDENGQLRVQVQPGSSIVHLSARATEPLDTLTARLAEGIEQEIWSYAAVPGLRVSSVSGAVQVDPRQAEVPGDWIELPAFAMGEGDKLVIEQRSRGLDSAVGNRLQLQREAWLDFSGAGWFARDRISGRMNNGWRFDLAAPFVLQRAQASGGNGDALLITKGASADLSGVEWRDPDVDLAAGLRIDAATGAMPVSGWRETFDAVSTTLHLPYGYRLIAAPGTDRASGSWLSRWTLLDVFLAAIVVLAAARLFGWLGGLVTAGYLVLAYQESGAPLWTLLIVLALALIVGALPNGKLLKWVGALRLAALVVLLFVALPFAAGQLRMALYPQLETSIGTYGVDFNASAGRNPGATQYAADDYASNAPQEAVQEMAPPPPPAPPAPQGLDSLGGSVSANLQVDRKSVQSALVLKRSKIGNRYSQSTVVQTGAGEPGWRLGNQYQLNWSGPVLAEQDVRLLIASPWQVRLLRVVLVGLLGFVLWRVLVGMRRPARPLTATARAGLLVVAMSALFLPAAHAQDYPPDALLQQLQARLTAAPDCVPQCAAIADAQVVLRGDALQLGLEVHALERVAVPMPADAKALATQSIRIDGALRDAAVQSDGRSWVAVERGVHRLDIAFSILGDRVALAFPMAPARVRLDAPGWQASGVAEDRLLTETLTLARARAGSSEAATPAEQRFPPFVRVHRILNLGLQWSVENVVERLAPREGGFTVAVPTIDGEHVATPGLKLRDGALTIALADREGQAGWSSTLDQVDHIRLTAPALGERAEVWRVLVGSSWHVEFSGVPDSGMQDSGDFHEFEFHPLPGETLDLAIHKPVAVEGATRAIDSLSLRSEIGLRARTHALAMAVRASQGGEQVISLPGDVELLGVSRDGENMAARLLDGRLSLPLHPGLQKYEVRFRDNAQMTTRVATPEIALGLPAANISLSLSLPGDRWLLAAFGPAVGPAVLFWGELLVAIVLAWLLARWRKGGLRFHHWLLLVLGFSTFSWMALLVVVAWLFALDWRARATVESNWKFNLAQIGLALLSLVALVCLFANIRNGLLGSPDMVVRGNGSYANQLQWFADRSVDALPGASAISLPLWVYNLVMLVWALWLAWAVVGWLRAGFRAWTRDGYWRPWRVPEEEPTLDVPPSPPPPV